MRFPPYLLIGLVAGCCSEPPSRLIAADAPPTSSPQAPDGIYADVSSEGGESLWAILTGNRTVTRNPGESVLIKVHHDASGHAVVTRLVNGVEVQRHRIALEARGGYFYLHRPEFVTVIVVTTIGCDDILLGLTPNGDLRVFERGEAVIFLTVLPVFPDVFPRNYTFRAVGSLLLSRGGS